MSRQRAQAGVTLVELAVVVALMGFLAAMAAPSLSAYFRRQDARSQAQYVADVLSQARALAIREGNPYMVLFDPVDGTFQIVDDDDADFQVDGGEVTKDVPVRQPGMKTDVNVWQAGAPAADPVPEDPAAFPAIPSPGVTFPDDVVRSQPGIAFNTQGFPISLPAAIGGPPGAPGSGQGSYYVTDNDQVVYAATLLPLGSTRVRIWRPALTDWY